MPDGQPEEFDVVVLGGGPAGEHAADRCCRGGLSTVVVEAELLGGECSYWACMPSKVLLRPGQVLAAARNVPGAREAITGTIDVDAALARRDWVTASWDDHGQVDWLASVGAALVRGHGRLVGERLVAVDQEGTTRLLRVRRAVIVATGSHGVSPPVPGLSDIHSWNNRDITAAKAAPESLLILGGGVVGVEMAQAWRRLGTSDVTIVEIGPRLVAQTEPFVGDLLAQVFAAEGIAVRTNTKIAAVDRAGTDGPVELRLESGEVLRAVELLVAAGRRANTDDIGLESVGLEAGRPIAVGDDLRASGVEGGWLYAIGDANGRALLTHIGKYQARIAVKNILGGEMRTVAEPHAVPAVIFTDPAIGTVGFTEQSARDQGLAIRTVRVETSSVAGSSVVGESVAGSCQLVVDTVTDSIVGATLVGPEMGEAIHAATIAIVGKVPMRELFHAVPSFPTLSEVWLELVERYLDEAPAR